MPQPHPLTAVRTHPFPVDRLPLLTPPHVPAQDKGCIIFYQKCTDDMLVRFIKLLPSLRVNGEV